jgi:hypothetical protein
MKTDAAREELNELRQVLDRLAQALIDVPNGRAGSLLLAEVLVSCDKVGKKLDKFGGKLTAAGERARRPAAG